MSNNTANTVNTTNNETMLKEIDLIQSCIKRMGQNSFMVKGWALTLNGLVMGVLSDKGNPLVTQIICMISIFCFWGLDAFFLRTEKLYRWKYEWVIKRRSSTMDYAYDLDPYNENMWLDIKLKNGNTKKRKKPCIPRMMITKTLWPMYITLLLTNVALIIYYFLSNAQLTP